MLTPLGTVATYRLTPPPFRRLCALPLAWLLVFGYVLARGWYLLGYLPRSGDPSDPNALGWDLDLSSMLTFYLSLPVFLSVLYAAGSSAMQGLAVRRGKSQWATRFDWWGLALYAILLGAIGAIRFACFAQFDWVTD